MTTLAGLGNYGEGGSNHPRFSWPKLAARAIVSSTELRNGKDILDIDLMRFIFHNYALTPSLASPVDYSHPRWELRRSCIMCGVEEERKEEGKRQRVHGREAHEKMLKIVESIP